MARPLKCFCPFTKGETRTNHTGPFLTLNLTLIIIQCIRCGVLPHHL